MRQQPSASTPPSGVTPSGGGTRSYANNRLHHSTAHTPVLPLHGAAPSSGGYSSSTTASPVQPTPTASPQSSVGPPLVSPPFASSSKAMMISGTPTLRTPTSSSTQPTSQQAPMRPLTRVLLQNTAASQQPAYHVDPHIGLQQPLSAPQRHRTPPPLLHNDPSKAFPLRSPPNLSHTASATSSNTTRSTPGGMMLQSPPLSSPPQVPNLQDSSALAQPPAVPPPNRATRKVTVTIREDAASGAQLQQQPVTSSLRRHGGAPASASSSSRPASGTWKNALNPTKRQSAPPSSSTAASAASQSTQPKSWCPPSYNLDDGSHVGMTGSGLLVGRFIIVTGGLRSVDNTPLNTVSCFDTRYGRWIPNVCNSGGGGKEGPSSAVPSPPLSQTAPQPWVLPEPLYGHCCVTHGQRSVWLVGGVSGSNLSRTIIRLTVDVHFASGTTQAATSHQSPAPFGAAGTTPPPEEIFNRGPPMSSASKAFASSHNNNATAGGNFGASSIQEDDSPTHFSVTNCRYYHLEFPVGFATCVKLHGALNPVALIMGGMSTVRDSDTGDIYPTTAVTSSGLVSTSSPATASTPSGHVSGSQATSAFGNNHASPNGAVLLPTASVPPPSDYAQRSQEARRLGITNRVFALNLDDCSMFRVAQLGDVPAPRMMGAAAPLLRRDVSGSYGSIVYYGGITAPQTGATGKTSGSTMGATTTANSSSTISTPFFSGKPKQPTKSSSTASVGGGNNGSKPVVDDSRFVFVASVLHDPKSKTFSLIWTHHKQRSKADPWPSAIAGHSLSPMPGFALLLGGCPTIPVQKTSGGDEEPDSPQTPLPCHRTLALLYDVSSGVAWTEVNPTSSVAPSSTSSSSCAAAFTMQDCNQLVYHRALVVEAPSGGDTTSSPPSSRPSTQGPTPAGSMSDAVGASLTSTVFVIGGGPSCPAGMTSSCSPARGRNTLIASFTIPHSLMQSTIPHSDSDEECQECTIHVQIEVSKHNSAGSTSTSSSSALFSKGSTATSAGGTATTTNTTNSSASHGVIDHEFTLERKHVCIDKLVQFIADKIITDNAAFRPFLSKAMILPLNPSLNQIDAVKRVIVNNLLLYSRSSDGERVPLSNDHVLDRMVRRAGLNAMPLVASLIPPIKGYRLLSKLGEGSFGKVYSAMNEDNGQFFAVKRVRFASDQREQLLREIRLLRCLDHPNIVKYLGVEVSEEKQMANIFLEYVKMEGCGDLTSLLRRLGSNPPLTIIRSHLRQVLAALVYLHSYHIVHQDIKGANVLVGVDVTKLADFGTARQLVPEDDQELSGVGDGGEDGNESEMGSVSEPASNTVSPRQQQQQSTASGVSPRRASLSSATRSNGGGPTIRNRREAREGTAVFMAPEVLIGGEHEEMTTSSDIWSVGCLLIEMTTGKLPWLSQLTGDRRDALIELRNRMMRQEKPSYPSRQDFPASGVRFLDDCLVYDPRMRKSAAQLYEHPFLTDDFDEDNSPEWSAEAPRCTSPLSGVSNLGTGFHLGGRQASDLICANSTLENCVETFEEFPPPSSTAARNENTNGQSAAPAPAVRRVVGLPSALRKK